MVITAEESAVPAQETPDSVTRQEIDRHEKLSEGPFRFSHVNNHWNGHKDSQLRLLSIGGDRALIGTTSFKSTKFIEMKKYLKL